MYTTFAYGNLTTPTLLRQVGRLLHFFFFFWINNGIVLKRSPSTPGVNMENSISNT